MSTDIQFTNSGVTVIIIIASPVNSLLISCFTLTLTYLCLFPQKLCLQPCLFVFGCRVINLEHLQRAILFHSESCLKSCNILMFWPQLGICGSWKGSADSHSASSYRQCSPGADTDTALIIQTSARQQKKIEAMFFLFVGSQSAVYLPHRNSAFQSDPHLSGISSFSLTDVSCSHLSANTFDNSFLCTTWPLNKFPRALLHLSTFLGILNLCVCVFYDILNPSVNKHGFVCRKETGSSDIEMFD